MNRSLAKGDDMGGLMFGLIIICTLLTASIPLS